MKGLLAAFFLVAGMLFVFLPMMIGEPYPDKSVSMAAAQLGGMILWIIGNCCLAAKIDLHPVWGLVSIPFVIFAGIFFVLSPGVLFWLSRHFSKFANIRRAAVRNTGSQINGRHVDPDSPW